MSAEQQERIARKAITSCVSIARVPDQTGSARVVDVLGELLGVEFPDDIRGEMRIMPVAIGSGFIVSESHILTNNHVVEDADVTEVHFQAQRVGNIAVRRIATGRVIERDAVNDLALIKIEKGDVPFSPLSLAKKGSVRIGQHLIAMKNPRVNNFMGSSALVEGLGCMISTERGDPPAHNVMKLRVGSVQNGDSGSPVLNERGKVVGIMRAREKEGTSMGYAVNVEHAHTLLKRAGL